MIEMCDGELWKLDQHTATLRCDPLTAIVDADHPERGLQHINFRSARPDWKLLCVTATDARQWPATIADNYVRGSDLVAAYQASNDWPYAPQVYWSAESSTHNPGVLASLRLLVSIQTHLLDTHPLIEVASQLPSDDTLLLAVSEEGEVHVDAIANQQGQFDSRAGDCGLLRRLPGSEISFLEFMQASDFQRLHVALDANGACRSRWELFAEFLEKGVIRKAQLQMALVTREKDVELASNWCRQMKSRPLPLTT